MDKSQHKNHYINKILQHKFNIQLVKCKIGNLHNKEHRIYQMDNILLYKSYNRFQLQV